MKTNIYLIIFLVLSSLPLPGLAAQVANLYEVEVAVADQSAGLRGEALQRALQQVLLRVTERQALSDEVAQSILRKAGQMALQFRYRLNETHDPVATGTAPLPDRYLLWVLFDDKQVNQVLYRLGVPVWGATRPAMLVWLAVEQQGLRQMVGGDQGTEWQQLLRQAAEERGLPLQLPMLDRQDQAALTISDLWGGFQQPVLAASDRYQADVVLTGRLYPLSNGLWRASWVLYQQGSPVTWQNEGEYGEQLLRSAILDAGDHLARRYALLVDPNLESRLTLQVEGVDSLVQYARVVDYLNSIDYVRQVMVQRVAQATVTLQLQVQGDAEGLAQRVRLGRVIRPLESSDPSRLHYQLIP